VQSGDVDRIALLARLQAPFAVLWVLSLVACATLRLIGMAGRPLAVCYVLFGVASTLAVSSYFRSNILVRSRGLLIPAGLLAMSSPIFLDQAMGGILMGFNMPLITLSFFIAIASVAVLGIANNRNR